MSAAPEQSMSSGLTSSTTKNALLLNWSFYNRQTHNITLH